MAGLQTHATEKLMENGRASWPDNPWTALNTTPAGLAVNSSGVPTNAGNAGSDGEWTFNGTTLNITHMRGEGTIVHWDYTKGTNSGGNTDAIGSMGAREAGVGD